MVLFWFRAVTDLVHIIAVFCKHIFVLLYSNDILTVEVFENIVKKLFLLWVGIGIIICIFITIYFKLILITSNKIYQFTSIYTFYLYFSLLCTVAVIHITSIYMISNSTVEESLLPESIYLLKNKNFLNLSNLLTYLLFPVLFIFSLWFWVIIYFLLARRTSFSISY